MEFKLKGEERNNPQSHEWTDMTDYRDDTSMEELNLFREPIELEPEDFNKNKRKEKKHKYSLRYAIVCGFGMLFLMVALFAFVCVIVAKVQEADSNRIAGNSYKATGTIVHTDDINLSVSKDYHAEKQDDRHTYYDIVWDQKLYVEIQGKKGSYETSIIAELKKQSKQYSNSKVMTSDKVCEEFKDVVVTSPYEKGQQYEFYVNKNNGNEIYFSNYVDERMDSFPVIKIALSIGILATILTIICFSISGLPE